MIRILTDLRLDFPSPDFSRGVGYKAVSCGIIDLVSTTYHDIGRRPYDYRVTTERLEFGGLRRQRVVGRFDGQMVVDCCCGRTGLFGRLSACFQDYREPQRTRHAVEVLVAARVLGLALGYEDLNDHDTLRQSKLWSLLCGAAGRGRRRTSWEALPPGKSTLNRMELTGPALDAGERYKKIVADTARLDALLVDLFLDWHGPQPERIVLDVDATDDPLHGRQEGRFFHGYYRTYCYLPLYIFCGQQLGGALADGGPGCGGGHGGGVGAHRGADPEALARGGDLAARG